MARSVGRFFDRIIATQRPDISVTHSTTAREMIREVWDVAEKARATAQWLQDWHDTKMRRPEDLPYMPDRAPEDIRRLRDLSLTPFARTIVRTTAQGLVVDGLRTRDGQAEAPADRIWQRNALDARQQPLVHGMLTHGLSYNLVLPGTGRLDGERTAVIRGKSALRMTAFYRDDFDEYPEFAIEVAQLRNADGTKSILIDLYDDVRMYSFVTEDEDLKTLTQRDDPKVHGMEVCPIIRYADLDLEGNAVGEIEPYIPLLRRLDQGAYDRLVVQRRGAFNTRTATGIKRPPTEEEADAVALQLEAGDVLVSDSTDTRFGSLPATPIEGYNSSRGSDIKDLGATSQTPTYRLTGLGDNIGADAIAAANEALEAKRRQYKRIIGESHEMTMRLAGHAAGDEKIASDFESRVHWEVEPSGSLQSLAQALATMVTQTGMPAQMVWDKWPGWTREDTVRALDLIEDEVQEKMARAALMSAMGGGEDGNDGAAREAGDRTQDAAGDSR